MTFLPELIAADTLFVPGGTRVRHGDTLGIRLRDAYRLLRERLTALAAGSATPEDVLGTLDGYPSGDPVVRAADSIAAEVLAGRGRRARRNAVAGPAATVDVDLLDAEIMGAEDAIADLTARLRKLSPPASPDERQQVLALAREISERRAFLRGARRRLARGRQTARPTGGTPPPRLTAAQRARVEALTARAAPDTTYLLSPATGTLVLRDSSGPARIEDALAMATTPSRQTARPPATGGGERREEAAQRYELRPAGLPALYSRARRVDTLSPRPNPAAIVVEPRDR